MRIYCLLQAANQEQTAYLVVELQGPPARASLCAPNHVWQA